MTRLLVAGLLTGWMLIAQANAQSVFGGMTPGPGGRDSPIAFVGQCTGTTSCASVPAHLTGDLFVACVGRDASTTAPTLPAGWTSVTTPSINGTSTADSVMLVACKVATSAAETVTGFTSGGALVSLIYRATLAGGTTATCASTVLGTPVNSTSTINTTTTTVTYSSVTNANARSWNVGCGYAPASTAGLGTAPAGMTNRGTQSTTLAGHDTNGPVSSYSTANVTVTTAGRVITSVVEIKD